jgi:hypothetical protein
MEAVGLTEAMGARATEARGRREDERSSAFVVECLEGMSLDSGALVDVTAQHELCT